MTTYTATFRTADTWATEEIDAGSSEQALDLAQTMATNAGALDWCTYDPASIPLEEIEIIGPDGADAVRQSEDLAPRLAAQDLLDALKGLVERDRGEARECGFTDDEMSWLEEADAAIAKAKGGRP